VVLDGVTVEGRVDRLDRDLDGVVVTDYKSGDIRDLARARQRARDSLQLAVYALAVEAEEGQLPSAVQLHFLEPGIVGRIPVDTPRLVAARAKIRTVSEGIGAGDFPARPDPFTCRGCPFRRICPSAA
jgi:DNA helicase-2/ATP-dependent DNA helicase PcrA